MDPDQQPGPSTDVPEPQDSEMSAAMESGGMALLDSSIAQLNSDDEDSD